mmetsp:Transcript_21480/g.43258  ORF Transcript_21480/g.43258 Transcript_21480/m.43258 type:complete len:229 (-) Transcript_21480:35-721(-)
MRLRAAAPRCSGPPTAPCRVLPRPRGCPCPSARRGTRSARRGAAKSHPAAVPALRPEAKSRRAGPGRWRGTCSAAPRFRGSPPPASSAPNGCDRAQADTCPPPPPHRTLQTPPESEELRASLLLQVLPQLHVEPSSQDPFSGSPRELPAHLLLPFGPKRMQFHAAGVQIHHPGSSPTLPLCLVLSQHEASTRLSSALQVVPSCPGVDPGVSSLCRQLRCPQRTQLSVS